MLSSQNVDAHIQFISRALDDLAADDANLAVGVEIDERFRALRDQYRELPDSLARHMPRLSELSNRFNDLLASRLAQAVDRFNEVNGEIHRAEREKAFWREFLIRLADETRREYLDGAVARVRVRSLRSRMLPPTGADERHRLEDLIYASGCWEQVSQLSRSKLEHALAENVFAKPQADEIDQLCPEAVRHQVSCYDLHGSPP